MSRKITSGGGRRGGRLRKLPGYLARALVSAGLIYYIFSRQETSLSMVAGQVEDLDWKLIAAALAGFKLCIIIGSLRWQVLMKAHGLEVGFPRALALNYLGMFFSNFMPSLTGGDIVKAYYAARLYPERKTASATIVFLDRVTGLSALVFMGAVSVIAGRAGRGGEETGAAVAVIAGGIIACLLLGAVAFNRRAAKALGGAVILKKLKPPLKKVYEAVHHYRNNKRVLLTAFSMSVVLWCLVIFLNFMLGRGLGLDAPPSDYFVRVPVIILLSSVPVSVRGWGIRELLYGRGFGFEYGPTLSIILSLVEIVWSLAGGVLFAARYPMRRMEKGRNGQHGGVS